MNEDDEDDLITPDVDDEPDGSEAVDACIQSFLERQRGGGPKEISTSIKAIDHAIIGLRNKKMYVIAARPSMGKTALADTIRRAVNEQGLIVCEFSLEMGTEEIAERELAFKAQINLRKVMAAQEITEAEMARVTGATGSVPKGLWWIFDNCFSMDDIVRKCRAAKKRAKREGKRIGLIIIDYLQLLADQGTEGRQQSVSACSRMTKLLAKEMDCPALALSQLNRACEYREDKRPMMSDLRESGAIEQDADLIAFIYREHVYNFAVDPGETEFIIRKQRSGPIGTVRIRFNPRTVHFDDVPTPPQRPLDAPVTDAQATQRTAEETKSHENQAVHVQEDQAHRQEVPGAER